jgi:hypothetical protein
MKSVRVLMGAEAAVQARFLSQSDVHERARFHRTATSTRGSEICKDGAPLSMCSRHHRRLLLTIAIERWRGSLQETSNSRLFPLAVLGRIVCCEGWWIHCPTATGRRHTTQTNARSATLSTEYARRLYHCTFIVPGFLGTARTAPRKRLSHGERIGISRQKKLEILPRPSPMSGASALMVPWCVAEGQHLVSAFLFSLPVAFPFWQAWSFLSHLFPTSLCQTLSVTTVIAG